MRWKMVMQFTLPDKLNRVIYNGQRSFCLFTRRNYFPLTLRGFTEKAEVFLVTQNALSFLLYLYMLVGIYQNTRIAVMLMLVVLVVF